MSEDLSERIGAAAIVAQEQGSQGVTPDEFSTMLAQAHELFHDDQITQLILSNPERAAKLLPALSHMLRTTRITDRTTIEIMKLRWELTCRLTFLVSDEEGKVATSAEYYSWLNYGYAAIEDTWEGWRGKLVTERIRTYRIEGQAKQQGVFGKIKGALTGSP